MTAEPYRLVLTAGREASLALLLARQEAEGYTKPVQERPVEAVPEGAQEAGAEEAARPSKIPVL